MLRRKKNGYFVRNEGDPSPLTVAISRRVHFNEADVMGIVWHGNYPKYFEEASAELGRRYGLSYQIYYEAKIQAPIVQLHVDYHQPLRLDEPFTVEASYLWCEGARLNTEFNILRTDGSIVVTGYTIQMFLDVLSGEPLLTSPPFLEAFRARWKAGELK